MLLYLRDLFLKVMKVPNEDQDGNNTVILESNHETSVYFITVVPVVYIY